MVVVVLAMSMSFSGLYQAPLDAAAFATRLSITLPYLSLSDLSLATVIRFTKGLGKSNDAGATLLARSQRCACAERTANQHNSSYIFLPRHTKNEKKDGNTKIKSKAKVEQKSKKKQKNKQNKQINALRMRIARNTSTCKNC